jgi:signal peptidase I
VFLLRSFLFEPFKIPSGSMIPTLLVGDLILVNKFHYGIRLPVINKKIIANNEVQRGDVMVFRYPVDPRQDYIKRVVGLPGDEVTWQQPDAHGQRQAVPCRPRAITTTRTACATPAVRRETRKGGPPHPGRPDRPSCRASRAFPGARELPLQRRGRDLQGASRALLRDGRQPRQFQDSRYWGFVPDANIVGRAFLVWMNFGNLGRIGGFR